MARYERRWRRGDIGGYRQFERKIWLFVGGDRRPARSDTNTPELWNTIDRTGFCRRVKRRSASFLRALRRRLQSGYPPGVALARSTGCRADSDTRSLIDCACANRRSISAIGRHQRPTIALVCSKKKPPEGGSQFNPDISGSGGHLFKLDCGLQHCSLSEYGDVWQFHKTRFGKIVSLEQRNASSPQDR